jgi:hypothetical protein
MPHRIRLGPPWEVVADGDRTRHTRKFGKPRLQAANEQIWLVCDAVPAFAEVSLNGELLGVVEPGPFALEVTALLQPRNEIVILVASADSLGGVALEIRD